MHIFLVLSLSIDDYLTESDLEFLGNHGKERKNQQQQHQPQGCQHGTRRTVKYDKKWPRIKEVINNIITCAGVDSERWSGSFHDVYSLMEAFPVSFSGRLYDDTKEFLEKHVRAICKLCEYCDDGSLLSEYNKHWQAYYAGVQHLEILFTRLHNEYVEEQKCSREGARGHVVEIHKVTLTLWKKLVIDSLGDRLANVLILCVNQDRNGPKVDSPIHGVFNSFVEVQHYEKATDQFLVYTAFEERYMMETEAFYRKHAGNRVL